MVGPKLLKKKKQVIVVTFRPRSAPTHCDARLCSHEVTVVVVATVIIVATVLSSSSSVLVSALNFVVIKSLLLAPAWVGTVVSPYLGEITLDVCMSTTSRADDDDDDTNDGTRQRVKLN